MYEGTRFAQLRTLFRAAVSLGLVGAGGCAGRIDPAGFSDNVCTGAEFRPVVGVTPATPVDYLALREEDDTFPGQPPPAREPRVLAATGTACATASAPVTCQGTLAALRSSEGWRGPGGGLDIPEHRYVVFTRGDEVGSIVSVDALAAFLGPIEVASEAAWLARERGYRILCDGNNVRGAGTGFELRVATGHTCGEGTGIDEHVVAVSAAGVLTVLETVRVEDGNPNCVIGRMSDGIDRGDPSPSRSLGDYLARAAELEAAAVFAFERLARELRAFGAPEALVSEAERSARDEVRHASLTARLAARHGGRVGARPIPTLPVRSPYAVAAENAAEGCVRETFGALQATFQAEHARDPALARAFRGIARDETRHAALAWDVAAWIDGFLSPAEREAVALARREAVVGLRRALGAEAPEEAVERAGVPRAVDARGLFDAVAPSLWAA